MEHTLPFIPEFDENLDVGSDTLTSVNDADYRVPFAFTGKIQKITLTLTPPKLSPDDIKRLREAEASACDERWPSPASRGPPAPLPLAGAAGPVAYGGWSRQAGVQP